MIGSDIQSLEDHFRQLVESDSQLKGFLYDSGEDDTDGLYEASQEDGFNYPALVLFNPTLEIDDNNSGLIQANQENAFAILALPADQTRRAKNQASKEAQMAAFSVIKRLRADSLSRYLFRLDEGVKWTLRPMSSVGPDKAVGWLVDFKILTAANAQIGRD